MNESESEYPMRINKHLAKQGVATRREADALIAAGLVFVNGKRAELGQKVGESDSVEVKRGKKPKAYLYFAYNKPVGVITHSPQHGEQSITQVAGLPKDVFPVGRLDKDSSGLIILTNDGRVTDKLLSPRFEHDKEYKVKTELPLRESFKKNMEKGVNIEGYLTAPCKVRKTGDKSFMITLTEGKKHQIRRMVSAMHNGVVDLERTRILNIKLGNLKRGESRPIEGEELSTFLTHLGLS